MARVVFASAIARWRLAEPKEGNGEWSVETTGRTVRELLANVFRDYPTLRGYVLDEHGAMRHHVVAYLNGEPVRNKSDLNDPVTAGSELFIFQALSGGA